MEDYEKGKTDVTDKSTVEIPDGRGTGLPYVCAGES
jgi:hypothetical protein